MVRLVGNAFDVTTIGDRDEHRFILHEGFVRKVHFEIRHDMSPAVIAKLFGNFVEVGADDLEDPMGLGEDIFQLSNRFEQCFVFVFDLLALKGCQPAQLHIEDGLCLDLSQIEAGHQVCFRDFSILRLADGLDHSVQVGDRNQETVQNMGAFFGFVEFKEGAAGNDHLAMLEIMRECAFEGEHTRFGIH